MVAGRVPLEADDERVGDPAGVDRDGLAAVPRHLVALKDLHGGERDAAGEPPAGRRRAGGLEQVNLEQRPLPGAHLAGYLEAPVLEGMVERPAGVAAVPLVPLEPRRPPGRRFSLKIFGLRFGLKNGLICIPF